MMRAAIYRLNWACVDPPELSLATFATLDIDRLGLPAQSTHAPYSAELSSAALFEPF